MTLCRKTLVGLVSGLARARGLELRFMAAGALNTTFGLGIFSLLLLAIGSAGRRYMIALVAGQILSVIFAYATNKFLVFRTRKSYVREFSRFVVFHVIYFGANLLVLPFCVEILHFRPIPTQVIFSLVVISSSYFWQSRISFVSNQVAVQLGHAMTNADAFLQRVCPLCARETPVIIDTASEPAAERTPYESLIPYWNGFFKDKVFFSYVRCTSCGMLFASQFFNASQLDRLCAQMKPNMDVVPAEVLRKTQRGYFDILKAHSKLEGGYIELGPDIGLFTENCVREGRFDTFWLVEPNRAVLPQLNTVMADKPFSVVHDLFALSHVPERSAGVAVMIHVLDHVLDPLATLRELRRKLRPGGNVLIVTHDESSVMRQLFGSRWPPFCLQHPQLFSPRSMRALLKHAGYVDVRIERSTNHFPIQFLLRQFLWAIGIEVNSVPALGGASIGLKLGNMITLAVA